MGNYYPIIFTPHKKIGFYKELNPITVNNHDLKEGISEKIFFDLLQKDFEGLVFKNLGLEFNVTITDEEGNDSEHKSFYLPDITFYNKEQNILIDIEIDEPYSISDDKSIHYIENYHDEIRNDNFTYCGWAVIRFAEEQVLIYPKACIALIRKMVTHLSANTHSENSKEILENEILYDWDECMYVAQWTKEDAVKMALNKYRTKYLSYDFIETMAENKTIKIKEIKHNMSRKMEAEALKTERGAVSDMKAVAQELANEMKNLKP